MWGKEGKREWGRGGERETETVTTAQFFSYLPQALPRSFLGIYMYMYVCGTKCCAMFSEKVIERRGTGNN